ncbi:MAG: DUF285 domain-containing protein, partial [Bacteroidetes bacterium]|nr:DUF285 domain-containing protein [Bacteroidota bacterium]
MKKITMALLMLIMSTSLFAGTYSGGSGTSGAPYQIATIDDLIELSNTSADWVADIYFIQTVDIDASATSTLNVGDHDGDAGTPDEAMGFLPIATGTFSAFSANYDGQGFTISNLYINRPIAFQVGLFGNTGGSISNLGLIAVDISGGDRTGGIAGSSFSGTFSNCYSRGSVSGNNNVGGFIGGIGRPTISNCYSSGSVSGNSIVGGFVGGGSQYDPPEITSSYSTCSVTGTGSRIGGFMGLNYQIISNCYSTGNVSGTDKVGGFVGANLCNARSYDTDIISCYSTGEVSGATKVGGFVGENEGGRPPAKINGSYWNTETCNQASGVGYGSGTFNATGLTTAQMQVQSNFSSLDFTNTWTIDGKNNNGYPYFQWQTFEPVIASMQLVITTTDNGQSIALPLYETVNCTVDWGDGSATEYFTTEGDKPHTFATAGTYTVEISGSLTIFGYPGSDWTGVEYLTHVNSFGNLGLTSIGWAFRNADALISVPTDLPSTITNLHATFSSIGQTEITNLDNWDVSNVTDMSSLFWQSSNFNSSDITGWNVANVTNMRYMFNGVGAFNQDISAWNVSNVTNMGRMFYSAYAFNQNIGGWDVSKVTDMSYMFNNCSDFNQDISTWNVSSVTNMEIMFSYAGSFNQDISNWERTGSTLANVTNMRLMFFASAVFNANISNWDVSNVTNMYGMFKQAYVFNQDISTWDVSKVTNMSNMFMKAYAFNQDIHTWDVSKVTDMKDMFKEITLLTVNYDAILTGWAAQTLKSDVVFDGGNSQYTCGTAADARQSLIDNYNWTITDGGYTDVTAPETPTLASLTGECSVTAIAPTTKDN